MVSLKSVILIILMMLPVTDKLISLTFLYHRVTDNTDFFGITDVTDFLISAVLPITVLLLILRLLIF